MANNAGADARDPAVAARWGSMRSHFSGRRLILTGVIASVLLAALFGREVPWYLVLIVLTFAAGTELELVLASRARSLKAFEGIVTWVRVAQLPIMAVGLHLLVGPLFIPIAFALTLLGSSALIATRWLALMTAGAALTNLLLPPVVAWWGAGQVFALGGIEHYGLVERLLVSAVGLPVVAAFLQRRTRSFFEVHGRLADAVRELRMAQQELESSQAELERLNRELNDEVERQTSALGERNRYLTIINAISFALAEPMDDAGTLSRAVRLVARLLHARAGQASHRVTDTGDPAHLFVTVAADDIHAPRLPESLLRTVAETGRPLTSDDEQWTESLALPDLGEPYAVVPLVAKGRTLGAFALIGARNLQWGEQERHLLLLIGREMGVALENARLYQEALAHARRERLLSEFARHLQEGSGARGISQALQLVADHLETRDLAFLRLPERPGEPTVVKHIVGVGGAASWLTPLRRSLPALVQDRAAPLVLGPAGEATVSDALASEGIGTLVVAPVITTLRLIDLSVWESGARGAAQTRRERCGVLIATRSHGVRWDAAATELLQRVGDMLAQRIETDELAEQQRQRIAELAALANVARIMQSGSDIDRLCAGFAEALAGLLPYRRLYLARLSEFGELGSVAVYGDGARGGREAPFAVEDRSHPWFALRAPRPWRASDPAPPSFLDGAEGEVVVLPMRPKAQMRGVAVVVTDERLGDDQVAIVEQAVEQLALALDNATLYHQATARASHIQTLSNLARIVASIVDLREAFAAFAEEVRWLIPFDRAVMLLLDESGQLAQPYATYPDAEELTGPVPVDGSVVSAVIQGGSAMALMRSDPRHAELDWSVFGAGTSEVAAVPVRQGTRTAAIFAVLQEAEGAYATLDLDGLDEVAGLLGVTIERLRLYERAEYGARHDPLTDLPNYRYLQERLSRVQLGISEPGRTAVLQIDMDNLKPINDTLGHEAGDRLIQAVARRLEEACGDEHFVARSGGDEFTMVMEGAGVDEAMRAAEFLHSAMRDAHLDVPGAPVRVGVSIGIAVAPEDGNTPAELMHAADLAMYEAKFGGGTRTRLASDQSTADAPAGTSRRSHRIAETLVRSLVNGATAEERTTLAVAQRWTAAAMIGAGVGDDLVSITRMLVALEALSRVDGGQADYEREMAAFLVGSVRDDWRESSDDIRHTLARSLVPAAVDLALERYDSVGVAPEHLDALAQRWEIDPDSELWAHFIAAVRSDEADHTPHRRVATMAAAGRCR